MNRIIKWDRFYYTYEQNKRRLANELQNAAAATIQRKFKQVYYEPKSHSPGNKKPAPRSPLRGRGFRRVARSVAKRAMSPRARAEANLKNQLERMLSAYQAKRNRGTLRNMFNTMQNTWRNTGYSKKGAGFMSAAQMIMATYGFI